MRNNGDFLEDWTGMFAREKKKKIGKIGRAHSPIGIPFKLAGRKRLKLSLLFLTRSPGNAERAMFRDGHAKRVCSTLTNTAASSVAAIETIICPV